jgi:FkbM family methyltransferase
VSLVSAFNKGKRISSLLGSTDAIKAVVSWPEFSITSFNMVSRLAKQGILPTSVLDVGANVGQFAVAAAKLFPNVQVHSFEPVPDCFKKLRRNVSGLGNVKVYPLALGASEGEVMFHINSHSQSSSALPLARAHRHAFPGERETQIIKAKVSTLDQVFADTTLHPPVLLKLDVQGYEARTLRGGTRTLERVDYVVLETSFKPMYEGEVLFMDIVRMMEQQGLRFERPVGWLSAPSSGEILQMDALFVRAV